MAYINFKEIDHSNVVIDRTISGRLEDYALGEYRKESFRQHLIDKGLLPVPAAEAENGVTPLDTVRQLFALCSSNDLVTPIFEDADAGAILADRRTAADNQSRFEGYKLFELRYYDCDPESQIINFKYPYTEKKQYACQLNVKVFISNPNLYNTIIRLLYEYDGPILVYDYWRPVGMELLGTVEGFAQIDRM